MNINDFENLYRIKLNDIEDNFELEKKFDVPMNREDACENCGGYHMNTSKYPSTPWQGVKFCRMCKRIIVTHYQDAMGGTRVDVIIVYKEKL